MNMSSSCICDRISTAGSLVSYVFIYLLDNVKIGYLKRKNRDHKKAPKQDENTGNLQILLHL